MTTHRRTRLLALALLAIPLALAACGGKNEASGGAITEGGGTTTEVSGGGVAASCAFIVQYDGHDYFGNAVKVAPEPGGTLGTGTFPPCNDTGGALPTVPAEEVAVSAIQGVRPSVAIMLPGRTDVVLVRDDAKPKDLPKDLIR